jgi:hypothetical protein
MRNPISSCLAAAALLMLSSPAALARTPDLLSLRQQFGVEHLSVQPVRLGVSPRTIPLEIDGQRVTLRLEPANIRSSGFRLMVETAAGLKERTAPPASTWSGTVDEIPGSFVGATIREGQLRATIALGDGRTFFVQPVRDFEPDADPLDHAVFDAADLGDEPGTCEVSGEPELVSPGATRGTGTAALKPAELAFDADFEFYALNNSDVALTVDDIQNIMIGVNAVYERDCDVTHYLTTVIVRTVPADPYTSTDASVVLDEFRNHWNASQTGVRRDVAHLMTGKDLAGGTIGIAFLGSVCNRSRAYGLSQSRFSTILGRRVALTAHELGHNWNAVHCDGQVPCNIMCSSINGCAGIGLPNFEPLGVAAITSFAASRTCLNPPVSVGDPVLSGWLRLAAPSPTPFTTETVLNFYLAESVSAELDIYDIAGQRIARLTEGVQDTGWHQLEWRGDDHAGRPVRSGVYYARLNAAGMSLTRKLVLLR